jgi:hypothetical protein
MMRIAGGSFLKGRGAFYMIRAFPMIHSLPGAGAADSTLTGPDVFAGNGQR